MPRSLELLVQMQTRKVRQHAHDSGTVDAGGGAHNLEGKRAHNSRLALHGLILHHVYQAPDTRVCNVRRGAAVGVCMQEQVVHVLRCACKRDECLVHLCVELEVWEVVEVVLCLSESRRHVL